MSISITGSFNWSNIESCFSSCSYYMSGSYTVIPEKEEKKEDDGVEKFFEDFGYVVSWDFSHRTGEQWYELYKDDKLVCQVDMGVPLEDILMDFVQFHLNKPGISKSDYKVSGPNSPGMKQLLREVYNYKTFRELPNGQLILPL